MREAGFRKVVLMGPLGLLSGLPLALSGSSLQALLATMGVDVATIGIFTLVSLPYSLKFAWSPMLDRFRLPFMGRRKGWMILFLVAGAAMVGAMGWLARDVKQLYLFALLALARAFFSASFDVVFDAYRTEALEPGEWGAGAGLAVGGYRVGMLVSGAGTLILAQWAGWDVSFWAMAALLLAGTVVVAVAPPPLSPHDPPSSLKDAVQGPVREFLGRSRPWSFLFLVILYKLCDAAAGSVTIPFLVSGVGFGTAVIGGIYKGVGFFCTLLGAVLGGMAASRMGLFRSLFLFGIVQAASNLGFALLALVGRDVVALSLVVALDNLAGGMGTAAFVALLMALASPAFTATQYALLSALASLGRILAGPVSGVAAGHLGWPIFFSGSALLALPSLWLLVTLRKQLGRLDR